MQKFIMKKSALSYCTVLVNMRSALAEHGEDVAERYMLLATDLLIMDELQDRSAGDWENSVLNNLVDKRYSSCKPTLILTNETDRNKLREGNIIPASTRSRLKQTGGFISLNWGSYR